VPRWPIRDDDRGVAAQVAVIPAVLVLFFFTVQLSLWFYGREVVASAAQHGLDTARVTEGSSEAGERTVHEFLDQIGGVHVRSVSVDRGAEGVTVTITADPIRVVPFVDAPIRVTVAGPVERVAP
jgi:hypothetical protein